MFAVNGLSYLFVVASLLSVHLPAARRVRVGEARAGIGSARGSTWPGRDVVVRRCLVTIVTFSLVALTFVGQFPVVAERNLGIDERSAAYGVLYACFGIGAVVGALSIGTVFASGPRSGSCRRRCSPTRWRSPPSPSCGPPAVAYPVVLLVGLTYFAFITSLSTVLQQNLERPRARPV